MSSPIRTLTLLLATLALGAAEYVADPAVASGGAGTKASPWPGLETCISEGRLAKLQPGDTLYLLAGNHGAAEIRGVNADFITIAGAPGQDVRLSRLSLDDAAKWRIKDLRISPTFGRPYEGTIVAFGDRGETSGEIVIEGCEVFAIDNHAGLNVKAWMALNSGILMGRHAKGSAVRDCYIRNTRFALSMSAYGGIADGNIIENYSADGIRMTRDDQVCTANVIKGAFASMEDGDPNHDDAIQCFLHNKGTGTMRNLTVRGNLLLGHAPGAEPLAANNQGIGFFDGPLVGFRVEGNVVMVSHWHGVSLFDAQGCTIADNVTYSTFGGKLQPWVMLGSKLKQAKDNVVTGNFANSFKLDQPGTKAERNETVSEAIYRKALADLSAKLYESFGQYHRVSKRHRITGVKVERLPDEAKSPGVAVEATTPAKPALAQAKDGEVDRHIALLRQRLDERLVKGSVRFRASNLGSDIIVTGHDQDQYEIEVPQTGSRMTMALFKRFQLQDAASLSAAMASEHDAPGNALAAFFHLAINDQAAAQTYLSRAGELRQAVSDAFATR